MLRKLWKWLATGFSLIVILLAIGIGLFRLLLPMVPHYHERIEAFASEAAGTPVRIQGIDARWGLDGPQLRFRNAQLLTTDGRKPLLSAETGSVVLNLKALISTGKLQAGQILLNGLRLEIKRSADGSWELGGIKSDGGEAPKRLAVGLRQAQIIVNDELEKIGPWIFDNVNLDVNLQNQKLNLEAGFDLPATLGARIEASVEATGDFNSRDTLQWRTYVHASELTLEGWSGLMPEDKTSPIAGNGAVTGWVSMQGDKLRQASLQLDMQDVVLSKDQAAQRLLEQLKGRVEFDRTDTGWQASGRDLNISSDGDAWPIATFSIEQVGSVDGDGLLYADADYVRLQDIAPLADWIPDDSLREQINSLAPRGVVEDFSFRLTRTAGELDDFSVRADFSGLAAKAAGNWPGFDRLTGELRMDRNSGSVRLDPTATTISLPKIIAQPIVTKRFNGTMVWRKNTTGWQIVSDNIDLEHAAFRSSTSLGVQLHDDDSSPTIDLHADLRDVDVANLRELIPEPILKPQLKDWLGQALIAGKLPNVSVDWNGRTDQFPYDDGSGEFRVAAEMRDVDMSYARNWPPARNMNGTLLFRNASYEAAISGAELGANRVSSAGITIPDLRNGVVNMQISADGMLDSLHEFLLDSPAGKDEVFRQVRFKGAGETDVSLSLPLRKMAQRDVKVSITTDSGEAELIGLDHRLEQIEGKLDFENGKFFANGMTALVLGAPVVIDVMPQQINADESLVDATVAIARGRLSDVELSRLHPSLPKLMSGSADYSATVTFPEKTAAMPVSLEIISDLNGMSVLLPDPLQKSAAESQNIVIEMALPEGSVQTDVIVAGIANARVNWLRDGESPWVLDRGGIHFGTPSAILPTTQGLTLSGSPRQLDVGGWLAVSESAGGDGDGDGPAIIAAARLDVGQLDVYGQMLQNASLSIDRNEQEWLVQVNSSGVSGALFVPFESQGQPIIANMERLYIDTDEDAGAVAGAGKADAASDMDPRKIPEIDIRADDFRLGQMKLGSIRGEIRKTAQGVRLQQFSSADPNFKINGEGRWYLDDKGHHSELNFKLTSTDVLPTLVALDLDPSIIAQDAEVDFLLRWPGPPGADFKRELDGEVKVRVGSGQLQTVQPGAGRVFGLFSFTALPRRLSLDFRDVFDSGFGFDYIQGDFALDKGDAYTSNLILEGPAAQVGIAGRAGLVQRDYDQTAVVYGNFGAALPVAGVLAGGPVGGAAMLIFSELFKKPLQDMARVNYRITGSWDDPEIERVLAQTAAEGAS